MGIDLVIKFYSFTRKGVSAHTPWSCAPVQRKKHTHQDDQIRDGGLGNITKGYHTCISISRTPLPHPCGQTEYRRRQWRRWCSSRLSARISAPHPCRQCTCRFLYPTEGRRVVNAWSDAFKGVAIVSTHSLHLSRVPYEEMIYRYIYM